MVTFFKNRKKDFALMHCVAEYPTPQKNLNFNRLKYLINPKLEVNSARIDSIKYFLSEIIYRILDSMIDLYF